MFKPKESCQSEYEFVSIDELVPDGHLLRLIEDISLSQLAERAAMNPSYLSVLFKKEVGISISEYIQQAKIDETKSLLTYTDHTLTEIATLLNFHDQSYFTKVFTGVTPKQYKSGLVNR
jgi:YesN/AraC family two-component response regulator